MKQAEQNIYKFLKDARKAKKTFLEIPLFESLSLQGIAKVMFIDNPPHWDGLISIYYSYNTGTSSFTFVENGKLTKEYEALESSEKLVLINAVLRMNEMLGA